MIRFFLKRLGQSVVVIWAVSLLVFVGVYQIGDLQVGLLGQGLHNLLATDQALTDKDLAQRGLLSGLQVQCVL